ncbi:MAG: hypothetical protein ACM3SS_09205 [Rhodospirillaceae bacterium]
MRFEKPLWIEWLGALAFALVFGALSYVALTERQITVGGKTGIHHFEGAAAIDAGFFYLAVAIGSLGYLAKGNRFRVWIWTGLGTVWVCAVATYLIAY